MEIQKIKLIILFMLSGMGIVNFMSAQTHCKVLVFIYPDLCDNGMVVLHASPHPTLVPPFTFLWSNGETTQDITVPQGSGTYSVAVTDANGCYAVYSITLDNPALTEYFIEQYNGCANEQIYFGINWGILTAPEDVNYNWSTGETTAVATIPGPGTYYVTITDINTGCSVVLEQTAVIYPSPDVEISGPANLCPGQSGLLVAEGGPFNQYTWSEGLTTPTLEIFGPGIYWVQVTNDFYCTDIAEITVTGGGATVALSQPAPICNNQTTTIEVLNASDFSGFEWSNGQTTSSINVNNAGIYTVVATDASGCTGEASVEVIASSFDVTSNVTPNTSCNMPNGTIDITVNPSAVYSYLWNNGSVDEDLNNLTGGSYSVVVTDANGCTESETFVVSQNTPLINLDYNIVQPSCGQNNGSIDLTVTPAGSYNFNWSNGANTEDVDNLGESNYAVTVSDLNGCSSSVAISLTNVNTAINISGNIIPVTSCLNPNGSIDITINPAASYTYAWSNGAVSEDLLGVEPGNYIVVVTDVNGCTSSGNYTLESQISLPSITAGTVNPECNQSNGSIDLTISPPGNYSYEWNSGQSTEDINNLNPGNYIATVTDASGCSASYDVTLTNQDVNITLLGISQPLTNCINPNGSIDLSITPVNMYTYVWSNGAGTEDITGLSAGNYQVTVTDVNGCSDTGVFTVDASINLPLITYTSTNPSCNQNNGSIDVSVMPMGNYTYVWSNGSITQDLNNVNAGMYNVVVTDANGCSAFASITLNNINNSFTVTANITNNTSCLNANGAIDVSVVPAGNYSYLWNNGKTTEDLDSLVASNYSVIVTDVNSCSSEMNFTVVSQANAAVITFNSINPNCGQNNGSIDITVNPNGNYSYNWSNGAITEDVNNVGVGEYIVTIIDDKGCTSSDTAYLININNNFTITAHAIANTSCIAGNGAIDVTVIPAGNYSYSWDNGSVSEDITNIREGNYTIIVKDGNGCSSALQTEVYNNVKLPEISFIKIDPTCGKNNGSIDVSMNPIANYTLLWSNGASTEDLTALNAGIYNIIATNADGCEASAEISLVNINSNFSVTAITKDNTSCTNGNGVIDITVNPIGNYNYWWNNGSNQEDIQMLTAGNYVVNVTDSAGCSSTMQWEVKDNFIYPSITMNSENPRCGQSNGSIDVSVSAQNAYHVEWSNGALEEDLFSMNEGVYTILVTDLNGCSSNAAATLINTGGNFSVTALTTANTSCSIFNGAIDLSIHPEGNYQFAWNNGISSEDIINASGGVYSVMVSDESGCSITKNFAIEEKTEIPVVTYDLKHATCLKQTGSVQLISTSLQALQYEINGNNEYKDLPSLPLELNHGEYQLIIRNDQLCSLSLNFEILASNHDFTISMVPEVKMSVGESITIDVILQGIEETEVDSVIWTPSNDMSFDGSDIHDLLHPTFTVQEETSYSVMVYSHGCVDAAVIRISMDLQGIYTPNIISTSSLSNNSFYITCKVGVIKNIDELRIYDRWGNAVFTSKNFPANDASFGWKGTINNTMVEQGVYVWTALLTLVNEGKIRLHGDVTVVK